MNSQHDNTAPSAAPAPYRWEAQHPEAAEQIRASTTHDLTVLADAFGSGIQGLLCILNQPRCGNESDAYNWIEEEMGRLGSFREMIFEEIRHRPSDGERDHEEAIRKLIAYDLDDCGDGFMDAMATMTRMVAAHNEKRGEIKRAKMGMAA